MIVVNVSAEKISVRGHSGYSKSGKDIVCAGVSTLLQNTIKSIECLTHDKIHYDLAPGSSTLEFENLSERGKLLIDSFFIGVCMIAAAYPEYVRIA